MSSKDTSKTEQAETTASPTMPSVDAIAAAVAKALAAAAPAPTEPVPTDVAMFREILKRLDVVEQKMEACMDYIDKARAEGVDLDTAHVAHVHDKWFHHDRPAAPAPAAPVMRFDPFTGQPLN